MITKNEDFVTAILEAYAMEKGTREFYALVADRVVDAPLKKVFSDLIEWETDHMLYLAQLYQSLMEGRELVSFDSFARELAAETIESGIPISEALQWFDARAVATEKEAVRFALEIEGKAYGFYKGLLSRVKDGNAKVIFSELMHQEKKHIDALKKYS